MLIHPTFRRPVRSGCASRVAVRALFGGRASKSLARRPLLPANLAPAQRPPRQAVRDRFPTFFSPHFVTTGPGEAAALDRLDVRILRELYQAHTAWPARPGLATPYRAIARRLDAAPGTVRNRLQRMLRSGFLRGISLYPNPNLLGLRTGSYAIEVPSPTEKESVVERLTRAEGVMFVENFRGPLIGLAVIYRDEPALRRCLARLDRMSGSRRGVFSAVPHPPALRPLSPTEWAVVSRLMDAPTASYLSLSRDLGVSGRTLRRRLRGLVEAGAVLTVPRIDYRSLSGAVAADLIVSFGDPTLRADAERRIRSLLDDRMTYAGGWEGFNIYRLLLPNVALLGELDRRVREVPGVRFVRGELVIELIDCSRKLRPEHRPARPPPAPKNPATVSRRLALQEPAAGSPAQH